MELKEKVILLKNKGLNWFEIADILDKSYDEIRIISAENG